jgi:hypothetical protein
VKELRKIAAVDQTTSNQLINVAVADNLAVLHGPGARDLLALSAVQSGRKSQSRVCSKV